MKDHKNIIKKQSPKFLEFWNFSPPEPVLELELKKARKKSEHEEIALKSDCFNQKLRIKKLPYLTKTTRI